MSLGRRLDAIREKAGERIPPEALEVMHRATEELASSGILDGVARAGDAAPSFELESPDGRIRSAELLARGPLVLSFFRGRW
ncbi:MAG: hypothetical protein ACE5HP_09270 [Gemmatimonadota bacterium]